MQISRTEAQDLMAKITLVVEPADYAEQVDKEIRTLRQKANVPGFRPGKVPASLIKKMYGKSVLAEVINKVIGEKLYDYIREEKLNILGEPLSNEEETPEIDFDNMDTFTFVFDIALAPEFNCKLTASNKLPYYDVQVTDEMVQKQIDAYANRYGKMEKTEENQRVAGDDQPADGETKEGEEKKEPKAPKIIPAEINQELFDKVYGEGAVKGEKEFREKVKAELKRSMDEDAKYKFGVDAKAAVMKKMEKVQFPEAFLKRWLKTANKELTDEQIEKEWEQTLNGLRWQLAKDQLAEQFQIKVEKADVDNLAKDFARMQFMQYGLTHVEDQYLEQFAADMLKDENQTRAIYERCLENKLFEAIKGVVKIETKVITYEEFIKL